MLSRTTRPSKELITNQDRAQFARTIENIQTLPFQALLLAAGNNATLFLSQNLPMHERDVRHEPNDKPSTIHHFSGQRILQLYYRYQNNPKICVNGTSSDDALPPDVNDWLNKLAPRLVSAGVGHICGGAVTGAMGAAIKAWANAIKSLPDYEDRPEIATVLLKLLGSAADREKPEDLSNLGLSSVKQWSWQTRTPALHGIADQKAMLFLPGGLGTLYEVFFPLAARQFGNKGIVGVFDERRAPSEFVFLSSASYDKHFWAPTQSFLQDMTSTGGCKKEFTHIHLFEPSEGADAIDALEEHYINNRSSQAAKRLTFDNQTKAFAITALEKLTCCGLEPRDSTERTSRPFFSLMDNIVAAHITLYHLRHLINLHLTGNTTGANEYLNRSTEESLRVRNSTLDILERLSKTPAVQLVGSAKDQLWTPQIEQYSTALITEAVKNGFSVVISGCGTEGMPQKWTDLWVKAKLTYAIENNQESNSELVRVQASYAGQEQPARRFLDRYSETLLPTALTLDTRIELANCIGSKQAMILAPGGHAEVLAWVQSALNRQLFGKMYTPYAHKPNFHVLNVPVGNLRGGYYNGLLRQLEIFEQHKTIKPGDYDPSWFISPVDPKFAAQSLIDGLS
jgi:predicted Rossmann-fold nucleotide-binding protein